MDRTSNEHDPMEPDRDDEGADESPVSERVLQFAKQACREFVDVQDQHRRLHELLDEHPEAIDGDEIRRVYELTMIHRIRHQSLTSLKRYTPPVPNPSRRDVGEESKAMAGVLMKQILAWRMPEGGVIGDMTKKDALAYAADMRMKARGYERNAMFAEALAKRVTQADQKIREVWTDQAAWELWQRILSTTNKRKAS